MANATVSIAKTAKKNEQAAAAAYVKLTAAAFAGQKANESDVLAILQAAGKTSDDLLNDIELLEVQADYVRTAKTLGAVQRRADKNKAAIAEVQAQFLAARMKFEPEISALQTERSQIGAELKAVRLAMVWIFDHSDRRVEHKALLADRGRLSSDLAAAQDRRKHAEYQRGCAQVGGGRRDKQRAVDQWTAEVEGFDKEIGELKTKIADIAKQISELEAAMLQAADIAG